MAARKSSKKAKRSSSVIRSSHRPFAKQMNTIMMLYIILILLGVLLILNLIYQRYSVDLPKVDNVLEQSQ